MTATFAAVLLSFPDDVFGTRRHFYLLIIGNTLGKHCHGHDCYRCEFGQGVTDVLQVYAVCNVIGYVFADLFHLVHVCSLQSWYVKSCEQDKVYQN